MVREEEEEKGKGKERRRDCRGKAAAKKTRRRRHKAAKGQEGGENTPKRWQVVVLIAPRVRLRCTPRCKPTCASATAPLGRPCAAHNTSMRGKTVKRRRKGEKEGERKEKARDGF